MRTIRRVAVLGAGTMGARIAAHFANAGVPSLLLDIVIPGQPNRNAAELKGELYAKVDKVRRKGSILSTNTSGIPLTQIAHGFSADFRTHFLGTHFFNPPRYLRLLEII